MVKPACDQLAPAPCIRRRSITMSGKPIPSLTSDEAAGAFVAHADLTEYDLADFKPMRFEIGPKFPPFGTDTAD